MTAGRGWKEVEAVVGRPAFTDVRFNASLPVSVSALLYDA